VLQELSVVATRRFDPPMPRAEAHQPGRQLAGVTVENPFA
jgi:hypothetical protein